MKRKLISALIGFLVTGSLNAQIENDIQKILATKDYKAFTTFLDTFSYSRRDMVPEIYCTRDLTNSYQESVLLFEKQTPHEKIAGSYVVSKFRVCLIATDKQIVYYKLEEEKYSRLTEDVFEPYFTPIASYQNDSSWTKLLDEFRAIFQTDLNEKELFITDYVYGSHCSYSGEDPEGRKLLQELVAKKDKKELLKWLKSANTEKQLYAVDGLYQLKKMKVKFSEEELAMIRFVCGKDGTAYQCRGCRFEHREIRALLNQFHF